MDHRQSRHLDDHMYSVTIVAVVLVFMLVYAMLPTAPDGRQARADDAVAASGSASAAAAAKAPVRGAV